MINVETQTDKIDNVMHYWDKTCVPRLEDKDNAFSSTGHNRPSFTIILVLKHKVLSAWACIYETPLLQRFLFQV